MVKKPESKRFEVVVCCSSYIVIDSTWTSGYKDVTGHLTHDKAVKVAARLNKRKLSEDMSRTEIKNLVHKIEKRLR